MCREFDSRMDRIGYLIPGSRVTTIGEFGMSREWGRKLRVTCNGGVPKTKETKRIGDYTLVTNLHFFFKLKIMTPILLLAFILFMFVIRKRR